MPYLVEANYLNIYEQVRIIAKS